MSRTFLSDLTGSFSTPAATNPTGPIMEAGYADADLDVRYINCDVKPGGLGDAVRGAVAMGWLGFNCSLPHKVAILDYLDELAPSARIIGAVNTVINRNGYLVGENTDGQGFVRSLRSVADPMGAKVTILGAGGAARAIAVETALAGASSITVINRDRDRGENLVQLINEHTSAAGHYIPWTPAIGIPADTTVLINATSVGFAPNHQIAPDIDMSSIPAGIVVADVVANPPHTRFLTAAAERNCTTLTGVGMLVNQALTNAYLWTGHHLNGDVMRDVLTEILRTTEEEN